MNAWLSTTFIIAFTTESRIAACCAFRSSRGTAIVRVMKSVRGKLLKIHELRSDLRPQRQWNLTTRLGRFVDPQNELERLSARPAVGIGFGFPSQDGEHVPVVALVAEPVD